MKEPSQELGYPHCVFSLHCSIMNICSSCTGVLQTQPHSRDSLFVGTEVKHQMDKAAAYKCKSSVSHGSPWLYPQNCWCSLHETVIEQISSVPQPHSLNSELYSVSLQHITPLLPRGMRWNYRYSLTPILLLVWDQMIHVPIKGFEMVVFVSEVPVQSELYLKDYIKA